MKITYKTVKPMNVRSRGFLKEALGEGRRADGPFPGASLDAAVDILFVSL